MFTRNFISTILLFTFSFVLVHNIIPHHHHDEVSDICYYEYNHDKHDQDHQGENDEPIGFFSHLTHLISTTEFSFTCGNNHNFQKTQTLKHYIKNTDFVFRQLKILVKSEHTHYIFIAVKQFFYSTLFLRGPPVLSV